MSTTLSEHIRNVCSPYDKDAASEYYSRLIPLLKTNFMLSGNRVTQIFPLCYPGRLKLLEDGFQKTEAFFYESLFINVGEFIRHRLKLLSDPTQDNFSGINWVDEFFRLTLVSKNYFMEAIKDNVDPDLYWKIHKVTYDTLRSSKPQDAVYAMYIMYKSHVEEGLYILENTLRCYKPYLELK